MNDLTNSASLHFSSPRRIADQSSAYRNKIELCLVQPLQQKVNIIFLILLGYRARKSTVESHRAYRDRRFAGYLLRPACQIKIRPFELRLPETPGGAVEDIHTRIAERCQEAGQIFRRLHKSGVIMAALPLREAEHNREVRSYRTAAGIDHFNRKGGPCLKITAIFVVTAVSLLPEELVDQIAVGPV